MKNTVYITGSGTFLPGKPIPVAQSGPVLGELIDAPPRLRRWIETSTPVMQQLLAISFLHYAIDPVTREFTEDNISMAVKASRTALAQAGIDSSEVDLICYGSAHQDQMPTASVRIQEQLGIDHCDEFSIHANCTSAYKALYLAHELVGSGRNHTALVVSSNMSSSELRAEYYNQQKLDKESLFLRWFLCDGAGALVVTSKEPPRACLSIEATYVESVGGNRPSLMYNRRPAYWVNPRTEYDEALHHLRQDFRNALEEGVFQENGNSIFFNGLRRMLDKRNIAPVPVRFFQVNMPTRHVVDSILDECETIGIPRSSLFTRLDTMGYCGPPMALIGLDTILKEEELVAGDRIISFVTEVSKFMQAGYVMRYTGKV